MGDILLTLVIWLYSNTLLKLPVELGNLPLDTFQAYLLGVQDNLVEALSGMSNFFPVGLAFGLLSVVIAGELIMFSVKGGMYLLNLIRGSGA